MSNLNTVKTWKWQWCGKLVLGLMAILLTDYGWGTAEALGVEVEELTPKITDVTVFKDGHALFLARGSVRLRDGWCRTREVPVPVLGTFWTFAVQEDAQVDFVKAGFVEEQQSRPCLTFDEIIQANTGKRAIIEEQPKDADRVSHEGVLLGILQHKAEKEDEVKKQLPSGYDRWGRYNSGSEVRETELRKTEDMASFVMLRKDSGVQLIKRENIRGISLAEKDPVTAHAETREVREITMHVTGEKESLNKKTELGIVYLQKGIRWIPNYRIELLDDNKAKISLQGMIINEVADLEDVSLRLVVGVPSFCMKEQVSPIALREVGMSLGSYFAPPGQGGGANAQFLNISNAIMSQAEMPRNASDDASWSQGDIPIEGQQEDLYVYHKSGISLKKGERAVVQLFEITVGYEDIYTWDIPPIPPRELWRHIDQRQQQQLAQALQGAKAMHEIRLENSGSEPWTTGPAMIFKGQLPLGQQLLTYTSVNNTVDVPVTVATDLNTTKEEIEISREPDVGIAGNSYIKVNMHGLLKVTNFKKEAVRIYVKRKIMGMATAATADGKISQGNVAEDTALYGQEYPWYSWGWPWWWYGVNSVSNISWETELPPGESVAFEYDYYYYYRY